ncbi:MAG: tetratricopeptide repeat protein, partial [Acidobacteria bacterium]|nr:tetratricopeptide repeat protein [Acidobacteriota bacterium]
MRCLAYNPNDRFRTATELAEAIRNPVPPAAVQKQSIAIPTKALQIAGILATLALAAYLWFRLSVPAPSQEAMRWYQQSVNAVNDGSFARASQLLERTLQVAPDFVSAHCRLAESYLELDRRDNAQAVLLKALSLRSRSKEESLLLEATKSLLSGSWDQVFAASKQRLASSDPQNATTARMDHARWLERAGQSEQAKEQYQIILKSDPSQPGALLRLASLQATGNQLADARTLFDKAESSFQALNNIEGLGEVALAKARLVNDVPEAIKLSASAEGLAKQAGSISLTVRAMLWRADRNTRLGQSEVARQLTLEAINAAEKSGLYAEAINAYIAMASVPYVQGKYEEAEQEFLKILALAKRYRTLRAEARTKVSLAMNYTYSQKARLALPLLDEALTFYQSSGMKLQQAHALGVKSDAFRLT